MLQREVDYLKMANFLLATGILCLAAGWILSKEKTIIHPALSEHDFAEILSEWEHLGNRISTDLEQFANSWITGKGTLHHCLHATELINHGWGTINGQTFEFGDTPNRSPSLDNERSKIKAKLIETPPNRLVWFREPLTITIKSSSNTFVVFRISDYALHETLALPLFDHPIIESYQTIVSPKKEHLKPPQHSFKNPSNPLLELRIWTKQTEQINYNKKIWLTASLLSLLFITPAILILFRKSRNIKRARTQISIANTLSHELRTPLTNIELLIDLLNEDLVQPNQIAQKRLSIISREVNQIDFILENTLLLASLSKRQSRASLGNQKVNLVNTINKSIESFDEALKETGIKINFTTTDREYHVKILEPMLLQVFANLISNANKYAGKGQHLEISIIDKPKKANLQIEFKDRGPGIPETKFKDIFTPFKTLRQGVSEYRQGTGLGLTISKMILREFGGDLFVRQRSDGQSGAVFVVELRKHQSHL